MKTKKDTLIVFLICLLMAISAFSIISFAKHNSGKGNPFGLYGDGNCCYFAFWYMEHYWPESFNIPGNYDARRWAECVGLERDGYRLEKVNEPQPGDIFVLPYSDKNTYGHVGVITGKRNVYDFHQYQKYDVWYDVAESGMYAREEDYPEELANGCRYRFYCYAADDFKNATFLRCVPIKM